MMFTKVQFQIGTQFDSKIERGGVIEAMLKCNFKSKIVHIKLFGFGFVKRTKDGNHLLDHSAITSSRGRACHLPRLIAPNGSFVEKVSFRGSIY